MRLIEIVGAVAVSLLLCSCKSDDRPARIVDPTAASRAALHDAVVAALQGVDVTLADDALTLSSQLIVEPTVHRDAQGNRVMGREVRAPVRFVLLKNREQCVLESVTTRQRWVLAATHCIAE